MLSPRQFNFYLFLSWLIWLICFLWLNHSIFSFKNISWPHFSLSNQIETIKFENKEIQKSIFQNDYLIIPKLNLNAPLIFSQNENPEKNLKKGVVAKLNKNNQVIVFGHSSSYPWQENPYGKIFAHLDKLQPGDKIIIVYQNKKYIYQVKESKIINPQKKNYFADQGLLLVTCWPPGTTWQRLVVKCSLIKQS